MSLPAGTVTLLMTDIEGSTRLWEEAPAAMRSAYGRHLEIITECVGRHHGVLVQERGEGDSTFAWFHTALDALRAVLCLQRALAGVDWPTPRPLRVRAVLHTGDIAAGKEPFDPSLVNRCARLRAIAHGGQTLLSLSTCDLVRSALPRGVSVRNLGLQHLKDLQRPEQVFQLLHPDLPDVFPPLQSMSPRTSNLPAPLNRFIGRERELAEIHRLLGRTRLLTLVGPGGCGKTRLAFQAAADPGEAFTDGVRLVDLAALSDPALVVPAVAASLGVREEKGRSLEATLAECLEPLSLLLLMDNCEHLIEACAQLLSGLLRACPRLIILATSRESLGIAGEVVCQVPPLSLPATGARLSPASLAPFEAIQLFVDRAVSTWPDFALTADNAAAVVQICRRLDGLPLAIELVAALVNAMTPEQIARRIGARLPLRGSRTAPPRQQTLDSVIGWSYRLLTEPERLLFRRLCLFAGGWTLEAAEAVCGDDLAETLPGENERLESGRILDLLMRLVDKSLVQFEEEAGGVGRYHMLATIRQYARGQLEESGEYESLCEKHRAWFAALADAAEPHLHHPDRREWFDRIQAEHDNLRAALAWAVGTVERLRLAVALWRFWYVRGYLREGRGWLEGALARAGNAPPELRAGALAGAGLLAWAQGDYPTARARLEEALPLQRSREEPAAVAGLLNNLGMVASEQQDYVRARACYEESLALYRTLGNTPLVAVVLSNLGCVAMDQGDYAAARPLLEESLTMQRAAGARWYIPRLLHNLGLIACAQGAHGEAQQRFAESLALRWEMQDRTGIALSLASLALTAACQCDSTRSARLFGAAGSEQEAVGTALPAQERARYDEGLRRVREALGESAFQAAWEEGRAMPLDRVIAYALDLPA